MAPEIVLIHGSWLGGWCWRQLATCLRSRGARCFTPTLTGLGEREHLWRPDMDLNTHVQDILNVCRHEDLEHPLLVGHSYGGLVATGVADQIGTRCGGLVIIDGYLVDSGQSAFDAYPEARALLEPYVRAQDGRFIEPLPAALLGIEDPEIAGEFARKLRPMPLATHTTALEFSAIRQRTLSRTYIRFSEFPVFEQTAHRARAQGWRVAEIPAGHMGTVTVPEQLADELLAAAHSG